MVRAWFAYGVAGRPKSCTSFLSEPRASVPADGATYDVETSRWYCTLTASVLHGGMI